MDYTKLFEQIYKESIEFLSSENVEAVKNTIQNLGYDIIEIEKTRLYNEFDGPSGIWISIEKGEDFSFDIFLSDTPFSEDPKNRSFIRSKHNCSMANRISQGYEYLNGEISIVEMEKYIKTTENETKDKNAEQDILNQPKGPEFYAFPANNLIKRKKNGGVLNPKEEEYLAEWEDILEKGGAYKDEQGYWQIRN